MDKSATPEQPLAAATDAMNNEVSLSTTSAAAANEMNGDDDNCAHPNDSIMDAASTSPSLPSSSTAQEENDSINPTETTVMETESNENEDAANIQLHEHHSSIPTASNDAQHTTNNNDESMIIQQCKSMEEASVTTTTVVESVVMMDADDQERVLK
eukprot:scaffold1967_cov107-Skeletonema_dohrnii-CCMP3373.AAC.1